MPRKVTDITDQRFGRLVAMEYVGGRDAKWLCVCDCGKLVRVPGHNLRDGHQKSCGCMRSEHMRQIGRSGPHKRAIDMTGKRYGRWTVIKRVPRPEYKTGNGVWWLCRCDCGTERAIIGATLRSGMSQSCGCLRADMTRSKWNGYKPDKGVEA